MPITGEFKADFKSFLDAIRDANVALVDFGKGASGVETRLNKMVDNFSGRKVIQEATLMATVIEQAGGVSKLTASELERVGAKAAEAADKLRRLGLEVPPGIEKLAESIKKVDVATKNTSDQVAAFETAFRNPVDAAKTAALGLADALGTVGLVAAGAVVGVGLVGASIFKLATDAAKVGGALDDMADKTGLSVPALSRLQNAANVVGADMGTLTDAVFKLEKGIGDNSDAFQRGLAKMGLSTNELKAAGPDHYLELVAVGLASIPEPAERAAAGAAIFGKSYSSVAAALQDLAQGLQLTSDIQVWTADDAARAEAFDQQVASIEVHFKAMAEALGRDLIPAVSTFVGWLQSATGFTTDWVGRLSGLTGIFRTVSGVWNTASAALDVLRGHTGQLPPELEKLARAAEDAAERMKRLRDAAFDAAHTPEKDVAGWRDAVKALGVVAHDTAGAEKDLTDKIRASIGEHEKAAAAAKKQADEHDRLAKKFADTQVALDRWDANVVANALNADRMTINLKGLGVALPKTQFQESAEALERWQKNAAAGADSASELVQNLRGLSVELPKTTKALSLGQSITAGLEASLKSIPQTLANAFTGGGGLGGALQSIGSNIGSVIGGGIGKSFAALGSLGGPIGAAIGSLAGPLVGLFGKLFDNPEKQINPIREAFVQAAGGLQQLNEKAFAATGSLTLVQNLLSAKNAEQYKRAVDALGDAFNFQQGAIQRLDDVVAEYGFTLGELPDKFRQGKLDEQFINLYEKEQILLAGGFDLDAIIQKQAKSYIELLKTATTTGSSIPAVLKPIVERMKELGLLTDESGKEFIDLGKVNWAETLDAKVATLVDSIQKLVDAITRIPKAVQVDVGYNYQPFNPPGGGDYGGLGEPIRAAAGFEGRVTEPTLFLAGEAGPENVSIGQGGGGSGRMLNELIGLRQDMREMPRMVRDLIRLAA